MERYCSTVQSPQRAAVPVEEEEEEDQQDAAVFYLFISSLLYMFRTTLSPIIRST
jgi:hypothetical protein